MSESVWSALSAQLRRSPRYVQLREALEQGDPRGVSPLLSRLPLPAAAWVIELLRQDLDQPVLVVVRGNRTRCRGCRRPGCSESRLRT